MSEYKQFPYCATFNTTLISLKEHDGKDCKVTGIIAEANEDYDLACLPYFNVEFEDGTKIVASEEEIHCEETHSAVLQWCQTHSEEIALRIGGTIEQVKNHLDKGKEFDPHLYDYLYGENYLGHPNG